MLNEHNTRDIAYQMEEHLETPVSEQLVKLIPFEKRTTYLKQLYLWTISKISDEEIKSITKKLLDQTKELTIKKHVPRNEVDALFLEQKRKQNI
jgi:hypothetical protein